MIFNMHCVYSEYHKMYKPISARSSYTQHTYLSDLRIQASIKAHKGTHIASQDSKLLNKQVHMSEPQGQLSRVHGPGGPWPNQSFVAVKYKVFKNVIA